MNFRRKVKRRDSGFNNCRWETPTSMNLNPRAVAIVVNTLIRLYGRNGQIIIPMEELKKTDVRAGIAFAPDTEKTVVIVQTVKNVEEVQKVLGRKVEKEQSEIIITG